MKVKDIIVRALYYAGRDDVADIVQNGGEHTAESAEVLKTVLYCFNAVEDELARNYFSLTCEEEMSSASGVYYYSDFSRSPVKILSVKSQGKETAYTAYENSLLCPSAKITVAYEYAPEKIGIDGDSAFSEDQASIKMLASGAAAEYCLINGEVSQASALENKYRQEIDKISRSALAKVKFPPRRWV